MPIHDLKCKNCAKTSTEFAKAQDYPWVFTPCECGGDRQIDFASWGKTSRRADNYSPITFGGTRFDTREDWEAHRKLWKATHNEDLEVTGNNRAERGAFKDRVQQDTLNQLQWEQRYRGFDNEKRIRELYSV